MSGLQVKPFVIATGFTLIEALIVISVVGILVVTVITSLDLLRQRSLESQIRADLRQISKAISLLEADTGKWPNGCVPYKVDSLVINLTSRQAGLLFRPEIGDQGNGCRWSETEINNWHGPYIDRLIDPWGRPYYFDSDYAPYRHCVDMFEKPSFPSVFSFGANGLGIDIYDCDDIFWQLD